MFLHWRKGFPFPRVSGGRFTGDPSVRCSPCDIPPEIAHRISCGKQSGKVGLSVQIDFHAAPDSIAELDRVLRITDPVVRFMVVHREDRD